MDHHDRIPFIDTAQDRITVQRASIHKVFYPDRFFPMQNFDRLMNELGYTAICEWDGFDRAPIASRYLGRAYHSSDQSKEQRHCAGLTEVGG
jgi:hypothetical protein